MNYTAILNKDGGTLKSTDLAELSASLRTIFEADGHKIDIKAVSGKDLNSAITSFLDDKKAEAMVIAGGDGSVSSAAAALAHQDKALGILPAGTMNLYARSLRLPLDILDAARELSAGKPQQVDIATVNGQFFIHHVSVGLHPKAMRLRNKSNYSSRYGKILASCRALISIITQPPAFDVSSSTDGSPETNHKLSAISISNNEFSDTHLPYADTLSEGQLGVYFADQLTPRTAWRLMVDIFLGGWLKNSTISDQTATTVTLKFPKIWRKARASVDGELIELEEKLVIEMHPKALRVIAPNVDGIH